MYKSDRIFGLFEETDTEESSLDDDFDRMHSESASSEEEVTDDEVDSHTWNEIKSESNAELLEDHELVEEVTPASKKIRQSIVLSISSWTKVLVF